MVIKIADFGISERLALFEDRFEHTDKEVALPLKWMAIESLRFGLFSVKTEVVSSLERTIS